MLYSRWLTSDACPIIFFPWIATGLHSYVPLVDGDEKEQCAADCYDVMAFKIMCYTVMVVLHSIVLCYIQTMVWFRLMV